MAEVWRIHLKSGDKEDDTLRRSLIDYCIKNEIVCIGWQVDHLEDLENRDMTPDEKNSVWEKTDKKYSSDKGVRKAINPLIYNMHIGDYIWTRDLDGIYYLGEIRSDYRISSTRSFGNQGFDIGHWRECKWERIGTDVPGVIIRSFARPATVQRVLGDNSSTIFNYSHHKWLNDKFEIHSNQLFDYLLPADLEDLVALYLQAKKGYVLTPSSISHGSTTIKYEYELVSMQTGMHALVQVKSGNESLPLTDFDRLANETNADIWLFFANESYVGNANNRIHTISREDLLTFARNNFNLLSGSLGYWCKRTVW